MKHFLIKQDKTIIQAMEQLNQAATRILFVVDDNNKLIGSISDGDIRRYIVKTGSLNATVLEVCNRAPFYVRTEYDREFTLKQMIIKDIRYTPVIDKENRVVEIISIEHSQNTVSLSHTPNLDIPVVIMAGGLGKRLEPISKVIPKALFPIGDKTIIELIMERFNKYGISEFYISLYHKSSLIKAYLGELNLPYNVNFIEETNPLGTVGSLFMLKNKLTTDFFLINCDVIIDVDFFSVLTFHKEHKSDLTIVSSLKKYKIPYGVCILDKEELSKIEEKLEFDFLINTGFYVFNPSVLEFIPENKPINIDELIKNLKNNNKKVIVYPISSNSWLDIGQWEEYKQVLNKLSLL